MLEFRQKSKKKNARRKSSMEKALWSTDAVNDLLDIVPCNKYYQRNLICTNRKNQNNGIIYGEILDKLKERENDRGENIAFAIQKIRIKFKRCLNYCKHAAMTIKTATVFQLPP